MLWIDAQGAGEWIHDEGLALFSAADTAQDVAAAIVGVNAAFLTLYWSIVLIVLGDQLGVSVGALFAGALVPGLMLATMFAAYAAFVEFGARGVPPRSYVRWAIAQWPQVVNECVAEVRARGA